MIGIVCAFFHTEGKGFTVITNSDYVHEGRLTLAKVCVGAGSQSLP